MESGEIGRTSRISQTPSNPTFFNARSLKKAKEKFALKTLKKYFCRSEQVGLSMKTKLLQILALWLLIGLSPQKGFSERRETSYPIHHITELDGLPSYAVYKTFKDSHGMIWFGTFNGICRFNGRTITTFTTDVPQFLNATTDIIETPNGEILCSTRQGLYLVNPYKQTCTRVCPEIGFANKLWKKGDSILVASINGLWIYGKDRQAEAIKISHNVISKGNVINDIEGDGKNGAWLCASNRIMHLDFTDNSLVTYQLDKRLATGNLRNLRRIGDKLYIGTQNDGLLLFDITTKTTRKYIDVGTVISNLQIDGQNRLYVATDGNGAYIIDTEKDSIIRSFRTNSHDFPLPSNGIYTFQHDAELGIYWFGFAQHGLCYNYHQRPLFQVYRYKHFDTRNLLVRSFRIHGKDIAIGTHEGLYFISEERDTILYFPPKELGGSIVTNIQYFAGHFVIATFERGLSTLNPQTFELKRLDQSEMLGNGNFSRLMPWRDEQLVACGTNGIFMLDTTFHVTKHFHTKNSELPSSFICDFLFDLTGKGWIGTSDKLALYDPQTQIIQSQGFPEHFFDNEPHLTFSLCRNGDILAVSDYAAYRSKSDLSGYTTLDLYERTKADNIVFIKENRRGQYWVGTNKGLFLFEKNLKDFRQFNENDNLPSLKFNRNEIQETPDGTFWFASTKGLVYLPKGKQALLTLPAKGRVILDDIYIDNLPARPAAYQLQLEQKEIHLTWNFRSQSLSVVPLLLNYEKPQGRYYESLLRMGIGRRRLPLLHRRGSNPFRKPACRQP